MRPKLKVGLLLEGTSVPYWASRTIERIAGSYHSEIVSVMTRDATESGNEQRDRDSLLYSAYCRLDRSLNGSVQDPLAPENLPSVLEGVRRVSLRGGHGPKGALPEESLRSIRDQDLDVLLTFGNEAWAGEVSGHCRYGVLSFSPGDGRSYDGRYTGFWEIYDGEQTVGSHVRRTVDGSSEIVYRSYSRTVMRSVRKNREQVYSKGISFMPRVLETIHNRGVDALDSFGNASPQEGIVARSGPGNATMARFFLRRGLKDAGFVSRRMLFEERWAVRYGLGKDVPTSFNDFFTLVPPKHTWWGDPQAARKGDDLYIFIEELTLPHSKNNGHISVIKLDAKGGNESPVTVLERPYHLSYPFVFEWKGTHYMLPESSANRTIELYEAAEFPYQWKLVKELMTGVVAVDSTLVRHNGLWWLFTNIRENEGGSMHDELFLFYSDDLLGDHWEPHPLNPIVTDARSARPAGRIFELDGVLYRPSQDCSRCYGYAVNINRVQELDEKSYSEVRTKHLEPGLFKNASRVHTFSHIPGLTVVDTYMAQSRLVRGR